MGADLLRLDPAQLAAARAALTGEHGRELMGWMSALSMRQQAAASEPVRDLAFEMGWILHPTIPRTTRLGDHVGDACRELVLWEERGRRLPASDHLPLMRPPAFEGLRVLELGCGIGCNLVSLRPVAREVVGVELQPACVQLATVMWEIAREPAPEMLESGADHTSLEGDRFDVVLILGALQYMPIRGVLAEAARLLAPGGRSIIILSHLTQYLRRASERFPKLSWKHRARELATVAGTLAYSCLERGLPRDGYPVYPTQERMKRLLREAGMPLDPKATQAFGTETCFVGVKAGSPAQTAPAKA